MGSAGAPEDSLRALKAPGLGENRIQRTPSRSTSRRGETSTAANATVEGAVEPQVPQDFEKGRCALESLEREIEPASKLRLARKLLKVRQELQRSFLERQRSKERDADIYGEIGDEVQ